MVRCARRCRWRAKPGPQRRQRAVRSSGGGPATGQRPTGKRRQTRRAAETGTRVRLCPGQRRLRRRQPRDFTNQDKVSGGALVHARDTRHRTDLPLRRRSGGGGTAAPVARVSRPRPATGRGCSSAYKLKRRDTEEATEQPNLYECAIEGQSGGRLKCSCGPSTVDSQAGGHADVQGLCSARAKRADACAWWRAAVLARNRNGQRRTRHEAGARICTSYAKRQAGKAADVSRPCPRKTRRMGRPGAVQHLVPDGGGCSQRPLFGVHVPGQHGYDNEDVSRSGQPDGRGGLPVRLPDRLGLRCVWVIPGGARPQGVLDEVHPGKGLAGRRPAPRVGWGGA